MNTLFSEHEKDYIEQTTGLSHKMVVVPSRIGGDENFIKQAYRVVADFVTVAGEVIEKDITWLVAPSETDTDDNISQRKYFKWYASKPRG